jgi:hypothetical protein
MLGQSDRELDAIVMAFHRRPGLIYIRNAEREAGSKRLRESHSAPRASLLAEIPRAKGKSTNVSSAGDRYCGTRQGYEDAGL